MLIFGSLSLSAKKSFWLIFANNASDCQDKLPGQSFICNRFDSQLNENQMNRAIELGRKRQLS